VEWYGVVWFSAAIPKHAFFIWLAFQDAITTRENMCRWGYTGDILYLFCRFKQESLAHLFFECSFSRRIWRSIMADCKVLDPPDDWDLIVKWSSAGMKGKNLHSTARKLCFAATVYNLWMQRNCLVHDRNPKTEEALLSKIRWEVKSRILYKFPQNC
jgi:hypothetical protein